MSTPEATTEVLEALKLEILYVPTATLHPNAWNPNFESPRVYESVKESIRVHGFLDPIAVRAHPSIEGEWEIIGGEHRWRVATEEGIPTVPITDLGRNRPVSDLDAKRLTLALNTGGEPDLVPLGKLLADMHEQLGTLEALQVGLPYDTGELENLLKLGQVNWDDFDPDAGQTIEDHLKAQRQPQFAVALDFATKARKEKYDSFVAMQQREHEGESAEDVILRVLADACKDL